MLNETALRSHRLTDDSTSTIAQFTWLDSELTALHYIHYGSEMRDQSYLCNNCIKSFILCCDQKWSVHKATLKITDANQINDTPK